MHKASHNGVNRPKGKRVLARERTSKLARKMRVQAFYKFVTKVAFHHLAIFSFLKRFFIYERERERESVLLRA